MSVPITVLMPVYNMGDYVGVSIESILRQTFGDFEFLIIDDGSTDQTSAILRSYSRVDSRIRVLEARSNNGLVSALNWGLEEARGRFIARFDGDDISEPARFEKQVRFLERHPEVGVVGTNISYVDSAGANIGGGRPKDRHGLSPGLTRWFLLWRCPVYHTTVMIRAELLRQGGWRYDAALVHAEDFDLWTRMGRVTQIASLDEVLVRVRVHQGSVSRVWREDQRRASYRIIRREIGILLRSEELSPALATLAGAFSIHPVDVEKDYLGAARLLFQCYRGFLLVHGDLSSMEKKAIADDVQRRLLYLARLAGGAKPSVAGAILLMADVVPFGQWVLRGMRKRARGLIDGFRGGALAASRNGEPE